MNNFEHRVLRIEPINTAVQYKGVLVGVLNLHPRVLLIKGLAGYSRCIGL